MTNQEIELAERCQTLQDQIKELQVLKHQTELELQRICSHSETQRSEQYTDGTYLEFAETQYTTTCLICGKIIEQHTVIHPWR